MIWEYYVLTSRKGICSKDLLDFEFEQELYKTYNCLYNSKKNIAYDLACKYADKYAYGYWYYNVESTFLDLVELINKGDK